MTSGKISDNELTEILNIVEEIVKKASEIIAEKSNKLEYVKVYHEIFIESLKEVLNVYDMPKPCVNFDATVEAWKQDRPAQLAIPDNLITSKLYLKSEIN